MNLSSQLRTLIWISLLLSFATIAGCKKQEAKATAPPPTPVKFQTIQSSQVEDSNEYVGNLEAKRKVAVAPQVSGRIEQILVSQEGDTVSEGTPIVLLRPDKQQADLNQAVATRDAQEATLQNARAQVRAATSEVARLEAQARAQEADVQSKTAALELAQKNYQRSQQLVREGAVAQQDLDDKQTQLKDAIAARNASIRTLEASVRAHDTAIQQLSGANAGVQAAAANRTRTQAQIESANVDLNYNKIVAPITGLLGDFSSYKVGDFVNAGQAVTTITQNDELNLRIPVPTTRSAQLRLGLSVQLIDPNSGKPLGLGSINYISPQIDASGQSILVKAVFPNRSGTLRDGQSVRSRIIWNRKPGILIPTVAVTRIGGQSFVYVADTDNSNGQSQPVVHQRAVEVGIAQNAAYPVLKGLKPGDRIAVDNILKLRDGAPVQPQS